MTLIAEISPLSAKMQSVYSTVQVDWAALFCVLFLNVFKTYESVIATRKSILLLCWNYADLDRKSILLWVWNF